MPKSNIMLSPPHMSGNELHYIMEAFETNWIAPVGPHVDAFEKEIASYVEVQGALALNSGTAAIHMALSLLDVKKGDTVFCSTLTFVASANPILYQKAEPVFIDSEPETWNMSPQALERAFKDAALKGKLPKAVIIVHLYGQSAKMDELMHICNTYDVPVIEDAAESLGATYKGKASGSIGKFGVYSFNGNKIITTSGGGMLVSNDTEALSRAKFLATQAKDHALHYQHSTVGYNYRLSNLLAGIGRAQLHVLEKRVKARRTVFKLYYHALANVAGITFMPELSGTKTNRWLTTFTVDKKMMTPTNDELLAALRLENIDARKVWKPLHLQPLFKGAHYYAHRENEHIAEQLFRTGICLPSGSNLRDDEQLRVIKSIKDCFQNTKENYFIPRKQEV